jgi:dTDP-4-dehydrorhamnose reductase
MNIFTIGGSGLVGSRITEVLQKNHTVDDLSLSKGIDITKPETLDAIRNDTEHDVVLHLAAKADVDSCEQDKALGENGAAYVINVTGTKNVAEACKASGKKLLYISTDFVFDGKKEPPYSYTEEDTPNPLNWYAMTKYKGEEAVLNSGVVSAIIRIAYPFRNDEFPDKKDFIHAVMGRLTNNQPISAVTDHVMTPTYIDDIAYGIDAILSHNARGIYHVVGSQSVTPYEAFQLLAETMGYDRGLIGKTTREAYFAGKAPRPFNLSLANDKIKALGVPMRTFAEGIQKITK